MFSISWLSPVIRDFFILPLLQCWIVKLFHSGKCIFLVPGMSSITIIIVLLLHLFLNGLPWLFLPWPSVYSYFCGTVRGEETQIEVIWWLFSSFQFRPLVRTFFQFQAWPVPTSSNILVLSRWIGFRKWLKTTDTEDGTINIWPYRSKDSIPYFIFVSGMVDRCCSSFWQALFTLNMRSACQLMYW